MVSNRSGRKETMRKNLIFVYILTIIALTGCRSQASTNDPVSDPATPTPEVFIALTQAIPATEQLDEVTQAVTIEEPTVQQPSSLGTGMTYGPLTLEIPAAVANGASGGEAARVDSEEAAWWQKTPGHLEVSLGDYYVLQGKTRQPKILVFPAQDYAELVPAAFESIRRLDNILYGPGGPNISNDQLPTVTFFNEKQAFAANIQVIAFQNGQGVRFLSEYGQSPTSANNQDLFYQFQGLTRDGVYYVVAIFPVSTPGLGDSNDPASAVPIDGIPFPTMGDPNPNWEGYYKAVSNYLLATPQDAYTPSLDQLDALIESIEIAP